MDAFDARGGRVRRLLDFGTGHHPPFRPPHDRPGNRRRIRRQVRSHSASHPPPPHGHPHRPLGLFHQLYDGRRLRPLVLCGQCHHHPVDHPIHRVCTRLYLEALREGPKDRCAHFVRLPSLNLVPLFFTPSHCFLTGARCFLWAAPPNAKLKSPKLLSAFSTEKRTPFMVTRP